MAGTRNRIEGLPWFRAARAVSVGVDIDAMDAIDTGTLVDRTRCLTTENPADGIYEYDQDSVAAAAFPNVVAPASNVGRWHLLVPSGGAVPTAQSQAAWFIDPVGGNDANDGLTALTALKTDAERQRRIGPIWEIAADISITYLNNVPDTDPVNGILRFRKNGFLRIKGVATVTYTSPLGGITALTLLNRATNTAYDITEVGLGAGRVGQRLRFTSGPATGYCWLVKDMGAGQYRISPPTFYNTAASPIGFTPTSQNAPAAGNTFVLESLTQIARMHFNILSNDWSGTLSSTSGAAILVTDIKYTGGTSGGSHIIPAQLDSNCQIIWYGCDLASSVLGTTSIASYHTGTTFEGIAGGVISWFGSAVVGGLSLQSGAEYLFDYDTIIQGGNTYNLRLRRGGLARIGALGLFDSTADGLLVEDGFIKSLAVFSGVDAIYGQGNGAYGVRARPPGQHVYATKPTVTGTTSDAIVGATARTWAQIPYVDTANNNLAAISANT